MDERRAAGSHLYGPAHKGESLLSVDIDAATTGWTTPRLPDSRTAIPVLPRSPRHGGVITLRHRGLPTVRNTLDPRGTP